MARTVFLSGAAWPVVVAAVAAATLGAKPVSVPVVACPWSGRPHVQDINDRGLLIGGVEYKIGRNDDALQFKRVLVACDASSVLDEFSAWREAEVAVAAQGAGAATEVVVGGAGAAMTVDPRQKTAQTVAMVDGAADRTVGMVQLGAVATQLRDTFVLALEATRAPDAPLAAETMPAPVTLPIVVAAGEPISASAPEPTRAVVMIATPSPALRVEPSTPAPEPVPPPTPAAPQARGEPAEPELTSFLASDDPKERLQGVKNLRRRTDDESVLLLRRVVREDPADPVALAAVEALAERADVGAGDFDLLLSGLAAGTNRASTVAVPATEAVGRYSEDPAHLLAALQNPDASVRMAALTAAGRMRVRAPETFDWRAFLAPLGSDPDPAVRAAAAAAIASIRGP